MNSFRAELEATREKLTETRTQLEELRVKYLRSLELVVKLSEDLDYVRRNTLRFHQKEA